MWVRFCGTIESLNIFPRGCYVFQRGGGGVWGKKIYWFLLIYPINPSVVEVMNQRARGSNASVIREEILHLLGYVSR